MFFAHSHKSDLALGIFFRCAICVNFASYRVFDLITFARYFSDFIWHYIKLNIFLVKYKEMDRYAYDFKSAHNLIAESLKSLADTKKEKLEWQKELEKEKFEWQKELEKEKFKWQQEMDKCKMDIAYLKNKYS